MPYNHYDGSSGIIVLGTAIASIVCGALSLGAACETDIAVMLIVFGSLLLFVSVFTGYYWDDFFQQRLYSIVWLGVLGVGIWGCILVFSTASGKYTCDHDLYIEGLVIMIVFLVIAVLLILPRLPFLFRGETPVYERPVYVAPMV